MYAACVCHVAAAGQDPPSAALGPAGKSVTSMIGSRTSDSLRLSGTLYTSELRPGPPLPHRWGTYFIMMFVTTISESDGPGPTPAAAANKTRTNVTP
jgi:hypothetical protein